MRPQSHLTDALTHTSHRDLLKVEAQAGVQEKQDS